MEGSSRTVFSPSTGTLDCAPQVNNHGDLFFEASMQRAECGGDAQSAQQLQLCSLAQAAAGTTGAIVWHGRGGSL